jgi:hypothetical protein
MRDVFVARRQDGPAQRALTFPRIKWTALHAKSRQIVQVRHGFLPLRGANIGASRQV